MKPCGGRGVGVGVGVVGGVGVDVGVGVGVGVVVVVVDHCFFGFVLRAVSLNVLFRPVA